MYLTLQRRTGLWLFLEKRIVGVENVVEEEEYNQFDKNPFFDTSYKLRLLGTNKIPCEATIVKKSIYRNQGRKTSLISAESFL
jgi:hypothetical protein